MKGLLARYPLAKYFFYAALVVNLGIYFLYNMIVLLQDNSPVLNDFYITFMPGVEKLLADPRDLYDPTAGICFGGFCNLYRNLPALTLYHFIFYQLGSGYHIDLFFSSLFIAWFNIASCWLVFKVAGNERIRSISVNNVFSSPYVISGLYMVVSWHYFEYSNGHTQAITGFFVLLGLYFMLREKEHLGFMSWSIATIFKLNPLMLIAFLIWRRPFSRLVKNVVFCIIPQIPNIVIFLVWPKLLFDFIPSNIAFSLDNAVVFYRVSGTISRELSYLFNVPITGFSLAALVCFVPTTVFIIYRRKMHIVDQLFLAILATITLLPDFWTAHALYVITPFLFWLSVKSPSINIKVKLLCVFPLFFAAPWFLLPALYDLLKFSFPAISLFFLIPLFDMIIRSIKEAPDEIAHS
jgi:hypothetical protein